MESNSSFIVRKRKNTPQKQVTQTSLKVMFFEPDLRHCLLIQAQLESCEFQVIIPDNLWKTCICSDIQKIFETFYLQFQILIFLSDNIQDFHLLYLVLESLWKLFTSNIKNHMYLIFFDFFIFPNFLVFLRKSIKFLITPPIWRQTKVRQTRGVW